MCYQGFRRLHSKAFSSPNQGENLQWSKVLPDFGSDWRRLSRAAQIERVLTVDLKMLNF
jgi:hypothetical protein